MKKELKLELIKLLLCEEESEPMGDTLVMQKDHDYGEYLGKNVFIRTVTNFYTGKVEKTTKGTMTLSSACWIADTGRFNEAMKTGEFLEVEPYVNDIKLNLLSFEDITEISILPKGVR